MIGGVVALIVIVLLVFVNIVKEQKLEEKQILIRQVQLTNVRVNSGIRLGEQERGVFGTVTNKGIKTIKVIKMMVWLLFGMRQNLRVSTC